MKLDPYLTEFTKINSNLIILLRVKPKILQFLEESIKEIFFNIVLGSEILVYVTSNKTQKVNNLDYIIASIQQK